jgi:hypothetical protein
VKKHIVAVYPYLDQHGIVRHETVRYSDKSFSQRRPDGEDGFIWSLDGVARLPYRLPAVLASLRDKWIDCTEGEKDADTLAALGLVATTNAGGAGAELTSDFIEYFRDRQVAVWCDNDAAGLAGGRKHAFSLAPLAAEVRLVTFPTDKPQGYDVTNYVNEGHGRDDVEAMRAAAPPVGNNHSGAPPPSDASTTNEPAPSESRGREAREKIEPGAYEHARLTNGVPKPAPEHTTSMTRSDAAPSAPETSTELERPVNLATLLDQIKAFILRFVLLPKTEAVATYLALWVFHTHAIGAADHTPFTIITSPRKRSGKSRLEEVLKCLVARPWMTQRTTVAALVRKLAKDHCTLLLDETDAAFAGDQDYSQALRAVLDAVHTRGATATLCVGQGSKTEARDFEVFTAVAIAGIGRLPDTIEDRGVRIGMKRKTKEERVERFRPRKVKADADALRARVAAAAKAALDALKISEPDLPDELNDRAQDAWEPLLAIADAAGGEWPQVARQAARALSGDRAEDDDQNPGAWLLRDIRTAFAATPNDAEGVPLWVPPWDAADRLHTGELIDRLCQVPGSPWATWRRGERITANTIAKLLEGYTDADGNQIHSKQMKLNGVNRNGYELADFEDAFLRFLSPVGE